MAKVSSRFVHEILPVATASLIGAMLVNHYGRQPASVVVQAQPSASEDAMVQSLREEHELIADFMKRREEFAKRRQEMDAERSGGATQAASVALTPFPVVDPPPREPRPATAPKAVARVAPKAAARRKPAPAEAPLLQSDPPAIASETPPFLGSSQPPAQVEPEIERAAAHSRRRRHARMGDRRSSGARACGVPPRLPDWTSMPPLVRTLGFLRQN